MSRIVFDGVSHSFGERRVLADVDLVLSERRIGIIGANGSGKSTLARMINGLVAPDTGRVTVDDADVARKAKEIRRKVGFIFTNPDNQIVMPTVQEDVAFSLRRRGLAPAEIALRTAAALERFGLAAHAEHPAHRLSGGQKQLLALAAVLVGEPQIIVADEPTTLLDARNAREIAGLFREMTQQVIVVTHQLELLEDFDRVIVIDEGRVVADDAPSVALDAYRGLLA
ncbi:energy-coupling factor ABC transporter ATP-binding protein [Glaciibacter superstes]|uniref:energy-coupling factor ABC transporter ATP-binding protein n=1 Tax=Glaciibacter superstes TaxID=501023 RepID=UPI0003B490D8|nr:ABC transporter ATP-binding protein [Glaciibacter superstes]